MGSDPSPQELRRAIPLSGFTTWKVGGPADWFAEPSQSEALVALVHWARRQGLPQRSIGAGSNLLVSDRGLEGLTLCLRRLQGSALEAGSGWVEAQAGEPIPTLARRAARAGLAGLEWSVGIPGTVGGAVVMNAGAQGGCIADRLQSITVLDPVRADHPFTLQAADLDFAYRQSRLQQEPLIVLSARFQLDSGQDPTLLMERTTANLQCRTATQPYHLPNGGSVFRNPEPQKAGQLIESLGLKGLRIGDAEVSPLHANFIVNNGTARAMDIQALIERVQHEVQTRAGIALHPEVKRLGWFEPTRL